MSSQRILVNVSDPRNHDVEVGMLFEVQAVNRSTGAVTLEPDSDHWFSHNRDLSKITEQKKGE